MKKFKLSMMSLVMILIFVTTVSSVTTNEKPPTNSPLITYVVDVDLISVVGLCSEYYVTISDEDGNLVVSPLPYIEGTSTYVFYEIGPISGKRIANLEEVWVVLGPCSNQIQTNPDIIDCSSRHSTFRFSLHPTVIPVHEYIH